MKITHLVFPGLALGLGALLVVPGMETKGWTTIGGSLGLTQRDVRLFNNFADSFANDNTATDVNFPRYDGAERAIWKAAVEWSNLHGTGAGEDSRCRREPVRDQQGLRGADDHDGKDCRRDHGFGKEESGAGAQAFEFSKGWWHLRCGRSGWSLDGEGGGVHSGYYGN